MSDTTIATQTTELEHILSKVLEEEWIAQGHSITNKITETIKYVVKQETNSLTLSGMMYPYGSIIAAGTKANKIPYSGRSGRGGTSLYIQALQNYVILRMRITDEKKSLGVAFAIATEQKKHGMPTPGSYSFTNTGKRLDWIEEAFKKNEDLIFDTIQKMCYQILSVQFDVIINHWQKEFNT